MTQNEIKNLDYFILRRHWQRKMKKKTQNEIIITLFKDVLQQTSASYLFHKNVPKRLISPYLPSYIARIKLKYTDWNHPYATCHQTTK